MKKYLPELTIFEKLIAIVLKKYTYKIYSRGFKDGFNSKTLYY